ncbi:MAG: diphosphate--fructose-6-phosphate 1-phosphotransferase [Alkalispirochaetaceae bacterium]
MKGNLLVGQSGGPTAVINSSLAGVVDAAQSAPRIERVLGMRYGIEGFMEERIVDLTNLSDRERTLLGKTPGSALGSCRYKLADEELPRVKELLEKHEVRYLVYIGGNDTMDTIHRVVAYCRETGYELKGVGIPKTVDNDLFGTDHAPGYPSAARYVALTAQQAGRLASDMRRVDRFAVLQTVGRDAGWLAASAALARKEPGDPPHLIYLPERPITREQLLSDVRSAIEEHGWVYIVVGEGVLWEDGTPVSDSESTDRFSNIEFGAMGGASAAANIHRIIHQETGYRGEFQIPESMVMAGADRVVELDRREAFGAGQDGVNRAVSGEEGVMVTIERTGGGAYSTSFGAIPLEKVANQTKRMPEEMVLNGFVSPVFLDYAAPLVGELPEYATLEDLEQQAGG